MILGILYALIGLTIWAGAAVEIEEFRSPFVVFLLAFFWPLIVTAEIVRRWVASE